jgi:CD109 antigen
LFSPTIQKEVAIEVLSTSDISSISYQIIGKGNLIEAKTVKFPNTRRYILNFKPKLSMIPTAQMVIYYLTSEGEIVSDKIEVQFENQLNNYVRKNICNT